MARTRLEYLFCNRDDFDGVEETPADRYAVDRVQRYEDSCASIRIFRVAGVDGQGTFHVLLLDRG